MMPVLRVLAPNLTMVFMGEVSVFFSYETCIQFSYRGQHVRLSGPSRPEQMGGNKKNRWSNTTLKHLAQLGKPTQTLDAAEFEAALKDAIEKQ